MSTQTFKLRELQVFEPGQGGAPYDLVGDCHVCDRRVVKLHVTMLSPAELVHLMNTRGDSKRSRVSDSPDDHAAVRGNNDQALGAEICKGCLRELRKAGLRGI